MSATERVSPSARQRIAGVPERAPAQELRSLADEILAQQMPAIDCRQAAGLSGMPLRTQILAVNITPRDGGERTPLAHRHVRPTCEGGRKAGPGHCISRHRNSAVSRRKMSLWEPPPVNGWAQLIIRLASK